MTLPKIALESSSEDLSAIEDNVQALFDRFVKPIDRIRSQAQPSGSAPQVKNSEDFASVKNDFKNIKIDSNNPLESRTHAFYRMLGFPVVGSSTAFYSPGFDSQGSKNQTNKQKIQTQYENNFKSLVTLVQNREQKSRDNKQIFVKQDLEASVYTLLLKFPLPFNLLDSSKAPLVPDQQSFTVSDRQTEITLLSNFNSSLQSKIETIGNKFKTGQKILKPFIVDPRIENTVTPDINKVCVPFLPDKKATAIYDKTYLPRPGIELIIRQRLADSKEDLNFLKDVENIISQNKSAGINTATLDLQTLTDTLSALSKDNQITAETKDIFTGFTNLQAITSTGLIKIIKVLVKKLVESILIIDSAKSKINWIPIPSQDGPITGALGASLSRSNFKHSVSELDIKITELRIKKLNAERQTKEIADIGEFASPFKVNSNQESAVQYSEQLDELTQRRDKIAGDAFAAMSNIEMIAGEISGLGLIDVLAIYIALWTLDLDSLLGFLDTDSFKRLYDNNVDFRGITQVSARNGGTTVSIEDCLKKFENRFKNIMSFVDKLFSNNLLAPSQYIAGDVQI